MIPVAIFKALLGRLTGAAIHAPAAGVKEVAQPLAGMSSQALTNVAEVGAAVAAVGAVGEELLNPGGTRKGGRSL